MYASEYSSCLCECRSACGGIAQVYMNIKLCVGGELQGGLKPFLLLFRGVLCEALTSPVHNDPVAEVLEVC